MTLDVSTAQALSACDREPITRLDRVQSFGFLIAMYNDWTVHRVSANLLQFLGVTAEHAMGRPLDDLVGIEALHDVRNRVALLYTIGSARLYGVPLVAGSPLLDLHLYLSGDLIILEGETSSASAQMEAASLVHSMMDRLSATVWMDDLHRQAVRQVRAISGFDRVMIYRFDHDGVGKVIAEEFAGSGDSFVGLHFPASDIPQQARALYLLNPIRIIADVGAPTVALLSAESEVVEPIDLSLAVTRSVSPVHLEYLRNMGVQASLSISIIVEGKLWGLIACHHDQARIPSFALRTVAELLGRMYSLTLESRLRQVSVADERDAQQIAEHLIGLVMDDASLLESADWLFGIVRKSIECDGLAIHRGGQIRCSGSTPEASDIAAIHHHLETRSPARIHEFERLAAIVPEAVAYADRAAGMVAIPISRSARDYLLLFRHERLRDIQWAGNPAKPIVVSDDGLKISPRKSFAAFQDQVRGHSNPLSERERRSAESLRHALIEVIFQHSEKAEEEQRRAGERQELLIAELNHRVRNILALIRGLVTATGDEAWDLVSYVHALGGRVQALARAHDQVTQQNWGPVAIATLVENECGAYSDGSARRVIIVGPSVLLEPGAVPTMVLVIHELVTNSAKYGALLGSGIIILTVDRKPGEGLYLAWRESGGPVVEAPTRRGFGSVIIERTIPFDFQGTAEVRYPPAGLEADFFIPERHLSLQAAQETTLAGGVPLPDLVAATRARGDTATPLQGLSVLLLEDNMIIALEAEDILRALGARHVTMVPTVGAAEKAMAGSTFDFAMLDVQLRAETSLDFSAQLTRAGVPHILASGYSAKDLDKRTAVGMVQKPYQREHMVKAIGAALRPDPA